MNQPPDIAVIIPTHNRAGLIPDALDSAVNQTYEGRLDVVVIDDGSTDHTDRVVQPYLDQHGALNGRRQIRYERLDKAGVVTARNTGIAMTGAPYVAFLDSDDYWAPDKLERQVAQMEKDPGIGVVHTSYRYVDDRGAFTDDGPWRLDNPCVGDCVDTLLDEDLVIFSSVLMRRSVIKRAAADEPHGLPFDPRWTNAQDYDLLLRAARLSVFAYIPEPLTYYRLHDSHGAMGNLPRAFGFHCRVQLDFVKRHGEELGIGEDRAREKVAAFIAGRAESAFWQRNLDTARALCDVAGELGIHDERLDDLRRRLARPDWMYKIKDGVDRVLKGN